MGELFQFASFGHILGTVDGEHLCSLDRGEGHRYEWLGLAEGFRMPFDDV